MRCPVCRRSSPTRVDLLPVNFPVQHLIDDLIQAVKGKCGACYEESRKLVRATGRCDDCHENLCDDCSTQHVGRNHILKSLAGKECDKHHRTLELYCFRCSANICVMCVSEEHEGHKCHAISKVAEKLSEDLKRDIEELASCGSRLKAVVDIVVSHKQKYERYFQDMDELTAGLTRRQRYCAHVETVSLEKKRKLVNGLITTTLRAINAVNQRRNKGKHVDYGKACILLQDVGIVLGVLIVDLSKRAGRLQNFVQYVEMLKKGASDGLDSWSSARVMTENRRSVVSLHDRIRTLLEHFFTEEDLHLVSDGNRKRSVFYTVPLCGRYVHHMC